MKRSNNTRGLSKITSPAPKKIATEPKTIKDILGGKRELSVGYDAEYEVLGTGHARQTNILINHIALVGSGR